MADNTIEVGVDLGVGVGEGEDIGAEGDGTSGGASVGVDAGGIAKIQAYLNQIEPAEDDSPTYDALKFAHKYVGTRILDNEGEDSDSDSDSDDEFSLNERGGELIVGSESEAKRAINKLRASAKKRLLTLLVEHIETVYRKSPTIKHQKR